MEVWRRQVFGLTPLGPQRTVALPHTKNKNKAKSPIFCKPQPWVNHVPTPLPEICWRKTLWTICGACGQWQFKSHEMWLASIETALSIPSLSYLCICRGWHLTQDQSIWLLLVLCTTVFIPGIGERADFSQMFYITHNFQSNFWIQYRKLNKSSFSLLNFMHLTYLRKVSTQHKMNTKIKLKIFLQCLRLNTIWTKSN